MPGVAPGRRVDGSGSFASAAHAALRTVNRAEQHELVRVFHRQRAQEELVDEREDRGVGADADRNRQDGHGCEDRRLPQLAHGKREVVHRAGLDGAARADVGIDRERPSLGVQVEM